MSLRELLLTPNPNKYPLPILPPYYNGVFSATTLVVQDAVQETVVNNLPSLAELSALQITDPVIVFSLTNDSAFIGMITGYSNVDFDAGTCSVWICYANDTGVDISYFICQAQ